MPKARFGLIGKSLKHSFSPDYFARKFEGDGIDGIYQLFELDQVDLAPDLFNQYPDLTGFNVTIPYKQSIIPHLHQLDEVALSTNSVNLVVKRDNRLIGYNTDVRGFEQSVFKHLKKPIQSALILGNGGAAQSVKYALRKMSCHTTVISRSGPLDYTWLSQHGVHQFNAIINTTPLGMYPNLDSFPSIPYDDINKDHFLFDLVYNPEKTVFLKKGEEQGAQIINGFDMLVGQADRAYEILLYYFNNRP